MGNMKRRLDEINESLYKELDKELKTLLKIQNSNLKSLLLLAKLIDSPKGETKDKDIYKDAFYAILKANDKIGDLRNQKYWIEE